MVMVMEGAGQRPLIDALVHHVSEGLEHFGCRSIFLPSIIHPAIFRCQILLFAFSFSASSCHLAGFSGTSWHAILLSRFLL
jgi:hypothetical protein